MEKIMAIAPLIPGYILILCQVLGGLVILATIIVRLTPSKDDDIKVNSLRVKFLRFLGWLPTIGVNPKTKKLEEYLKSLD